MKARLPQMTCAMALTSGLGLVPAAANDSWGRGACIDAIGNDAVEERPLFIVGSHQVLGLQDIVKDIAQKQARAGGVETTLVGDPPEQTDILYLTPFPFDLSINLPKLPVATDVILQSYDYFQELNLKTNDAELKLQESLGESICGRIVMWGSSELLQAVSISFYANQQSFETRRTTRLVIVSMLQAIDPAFGEDRDGTFSKLAWGKDIRAELAALLHRLWTTQPIGDGQ